MTQARSQRTGLLARKLGMSRHYFPDGSSSPVTILHLDQVQVVGIREAEKHGYDAVILGAGTRKRPNKPMLGMKDLGTKQRVREFRITVDQKPEDGSHLTPEHFEIGQKVDVCGFSIGCGFAGAMKRHNFKGLRASHGVSVSHRSHGSTGNRQDPGRVFKNKKMAGHMGNRRVTIQNLRVIGHDKEKNLLIVSGAIPGAKNAWVTVKDAIKVKT